MRSVGLVLAGFLAVIGVGYGAVHGLTPVVAQSLPAADMNASASRMFSVKMQDDRPCGTSFWMAMASSNVS